LILDSGTKKTKFDMSVADATSIKTSGDRAYICLNSSYSGPLSELTAYLRDKFSGYMIDWTAVKEAYLYARDRFFPVADANQEYADNEKAKVRFSSDGLTAFLILYPPRSGGEKMTETDLMNLLEAYGVQKDLVNLHTLRMAFLRRSYHDPTPIANGRAPCDGEPAKVVWKKGLPTDPEGFLETIKKLEKFPDVVIGEVAGGEVVGELHAPGEGIPGLSATGKPIPASRGSESIKLQSNLGIGPDGKSIISRVEGCLKLSGIGGELARIEPILVLRGSQDLSALNNSLFPGSVIVEGDLESAWPIKILGDLEVRGSVVRSPLEVMGSLFVRDGIIQYRENPIKVGQIVSAAFFDRAWVAADTIHIRKYSLKSKLMALNLVCTNKNGSIHGGEASTCKTMSAGFLGSQNAMSTTISAATSTSSSIFTAMYREWSELLSDKSDDDEDNGEKLAAKSSEFKKIAEGIESPSPLEAAIAAEKVYAGVTVRIGTATRKIGNAVGPLDFAFERIGPLGRVALTRR